MLKEHREKREKQLEEINSSIQSEFGSMVMDAQLNEVLYWFLKSGYKYAHFDPYLGFVTYNGDEPEEPIEWDLKKPLSGQKGYLIEFFYEEILPTYNN